MKKCSISNKAFLIGESVVFSAAALVFLLLHFFAPGISRRVASAVYIACISAVFIYLVLLEYVFVGCDTAVHFKMLKKYYKPVAGAKQFTQPPKREGAAKVLVSWGIYLIVVVLLRITNAISWQFFLVFANVMFLLNTIFSRRLCILSVWFLKNKNHCCRNCCINGWDIAIFASALPFAPSLSAAATALNLTIFSLSMLMLAAWEYNYHKHPERFFPETNAALSCSTCSKKCVGAKSISFKEAASRRLK